MMTKYGLLSQSLTSVTFQGSPKGAHGRGSATELLLDRQTSKAMELLDHEVTAAPTMPRHGNC